MKGVKCIATAFFLLLAVLESSCDDCVGKGVEPVGRAAAVLVGLDATAAAAVDLEVFESDVRSGLPLSVSVRFGRDK